MLEGFLCVVSTFHVMVISINCVCLLFEIFFSTGCSVTVCLHLSLHVNLCNFWGGL